MSRGKERLDWSSKTLIVFQVRHFLRPWETKLPIRRGHGQHYCVPKDISHLLRVSTLNGDFIVEAHDTHPVQAIHPSEIHIRKAVSVVCQGKSAPLFGTNSLNSARGPSSVRPTVRACRDVLPNLRPQSGRDKRTTRRESRARAHRPCQVVGSPLPSPST